MSSEETIRQLREKMQGATTGELPNNDTVHKIMEMATMYGFAAGLTVPQTVMALGQAYISMFLLVRKKDRTFAETVSVLKSINALTIDAIAPLIEEFEKANLNAG